jgi:hypothetical protein
MRFQKGRTMTKSRFTEEQIIGMLKEQQAGLPDGVGCCPTAQRQITIKQNELNAISSLEPRDVLPLRLRSKRPPLLECLPGGVLERVGAG